MTWFQWYVIAGIPIQMVVIAFAMHYFLDRPPRR